MAQYTLAKGVMNATFISNFEEVSSSFPLPWAILNAAKSMLPTQQVDEIVQLF